MFSRGCFSALCAQKKRKEKKRKREKKKGDESKLKKTSQTKQTQTSPKQANQQKQNQASPPGAKAQGPPAQASPSSASERAQQPAASARSPVPAFSRRNWRGARLVSSCWSPPRSCRCFNRRKQDALRNDSVYGVSFRGRCGSKKTLRGKTQLPGRSLARRLSDGLRAAGGFGWGRRGIKPELELVPFRLTRRQICKSVQLGVTRHRRTRWGQRRPAITRSETAQVEAGASSVCFYYFRSQGFLALDSPS